ncbi:hypothetical protein [Bacillus taeanensis]|uniref:hypothetical protein n=1 Tax=Bacillus taeanensis TaxID=273032 RepID=UPI0015F0D625|nr:hypothetical protein [Bacillus taeanensis]
MLKRKKLRHNEYYDMQSHFDSLYAQSDNGQNFYGLLDLMQSDENIQLAYRKISRFIAQYGKCAVTGIELGLNDWHCHHKTPYHLTKDDTEFYDIARIRSPPHSYEKSRENTSAFKRTQVK